MTKPKTEETWQEREERDAKEFSDEHLASFFQNNERHGCQIFHC